MATKKKNNYVDTEPIKRLVIPSFITGKKYYLYAHTRPDKNEPFYFGIGTMDRGKSYYRALCHRKRNVIWKRIVAKIDSYTIIIMDESDNMKDVIAREIQYIALMGKKKDKTGILSNLTDGGEGIKGHKGFKWTPEMRAAASERLRKRVVTEITRQKLRDNIYKSNLIGRKGKDSYNAKEIVQIDPNNGNILKNYFTIREAADEMKVRSQSISAAIKKQSLSKGYKWNYKNAS